MGPFGKGEQLPGKTAPGKRAGRRSPSAGRWPPPCAEPEGHTRFALAHQPRWLQGAVGASGSLGLHSSRHRLPSCLCRTLRRTSGEGLWVREAHSLYARKYFRKLTRLQVSSTSKASSWTFQAKKRWRPNRGSSLNEKQNVSKGKIQLPFGKQHRWDQHHDLDEGEAPRTDGEQSFRPGALRHPPAPSHSFHIMEGIL